MTQDARESRESVQDLRTLLVNAVSLGTQIGPQVPQQMEDMGQKLANSPDFSGLHRTQLTCWIAQLEIIIQL
jgi:hypothetical protein